MGIGTGATKRLMPVLFLLLVIVHPRSLTLPGAMEGVTFLFKPDFAKLSALGLAFFKLSIGMGTMITTAATSATIRTFRHTARSCWRICWC